MLPNRLRPSGASEALEQRIVPAITASFAAGVLTINSGDAAADSVDVTVSPTGTTVSGASASPFTAATTATLTQITFGSSTTNDSLSVTGVTGPLTINLGNVDQVNVSSENAAANATPLIVNANGAIDFGASTIKGTLTVSAKGSVTDSGVLNVTGATQLTVSSGDIVLDTDGNSFGPLTINASSSNVTINENSAVDLATTSASTLSITASSGDVSSNGPLTISGATNITAAAGNIALSNSANTFGALTLSGADVSIVENASVGLASITATGKFHLTSTGDVTDGGKLTVGGATNITAVGFDITLDSTGNKLDGEIALSGKNLTLNNSTATKFGSTTASGTLTVNSTGAISDEDKTVISITEGTTLTATAADITLDNSGHQFGLLTLTGAAITLHEAANIELVTATASALTLNAKGSITSTGKVDVSGATTLDAGPQKIELMALTNEFDGTLTLKAGAVQIENSVKTLLGTVDTTGEFKLSSKVGIEGSASVVIRGDVTLNASGTAISLTNAGNQFGKLTLQGKDAVTLVEKTGLTLGLVDAKSLTLTSVDAEIAGSSKLIVTGDTTLTATKNVLLTAADNNLSGLINASTPLVSPGRTTAALIENQTDTQLGAIGVRSLAVRSTGAISGDKTISVDRLANLRGTSINLTNTDNEFGVLSLFGTGAAASSVTEKGDTNLFTSEFKGDFKLTTVGKISDSGTLKLSQKGEFTSTSDAEIAFDVPSSTFGRLDLDGGSLTVIESDATGTELGNVSGASLFVSARGPVTDSGVLAISGSATVRAAGKTVTLDSDNQFGSIAVTGSNVTINEVDATEFGATLATGTLTVTSDGAVTQKAALRVTGKTTVEATGSNLSLANTSNTFGSLDLTAADVELFEASATDLAATDLTGKLTLTSKGAITQTGIVLVDGDATLNAAGFAITLASNGNEFGNLTLTAATAKIRESQATDLVAITMTGPLTIESSGAITQKSGSINVAGLAVFDTTIAASKENITLEQGGNQFGSLQLKGAAARLVESNGTDLGASTVDSLALTSGGAVTDSGQLEIGGALDVTAAAQTITLDFGTSTFGTVKLSGTDIVLVEANDTVLAQVSAKSDAASSKTGAFSIRSGGEISSTGNLTVDGRATLIAATGKQIDLSTTTNAFGSLSLTGAAINVAEADSTDLASVSASGTFTLTSAGDVTDSGLINVTETTAITATDKNITLDVVGSKFGVTTAKPLSLKGANVSVTNTNLLDLGAGKITGSLSVVARGITQSSGTLDVTGTTALNAGTSDITVNQTGNKFGTLILRGANATVHEDDDVDLGSTKLTGDLTLTTTSKVSDSANQLIAGNLSVTATGQAIELNNANVIGKTIAFDGSDVTINDTTPIVLGKSTASGATNITARGSVTDDLTLGTGTLDLGTTTKITATGADVTLDNGGADFGTLSLVARNVSITNGGVALDLGTSTLTGNLTLTTGGVTDATGAVISVTGSVTITAPGADISLDNASVHQFGRVTVTDAKDVTLNEMSSTDLGAMTATEDLSITSGGAITDNGTLNVTGSSTFNAVTTITFDSTASDYGTSLSLTGGNTVINTVNAVTLGTSNISGTLSLTAEGGLDDADTATVTVTGATSFTTKSNDIVLNNAASHKFGNLRLAANNVTLIENAAIELGTSSVGGNLNLTSSGSQTQTGVLTVTGNTSLTATDTGNSVTLNLSGNSFGGTIQFIAGDVTLVDATKIDLLASTTNGGKLSLTAGGDITSAAKIEAGATTLVATGNSVSLTSIENTFGTVSISAAKADIVDSGALDVGASTLTNSLTLTAKSGDVTQSGALNVTNAAKVTAEDGAIALDNAANRFGSLELAGTGAVIAKEADSTSLAKVSGASFQLTSLGNVTQTGAITLTGTTAGANSITANGFSITLTNGGNDFGGSGADLKLLGHIVAVVDQDDLALGESTVSGTFNVQATGGITDTGTLTVAGATTFNATTDSDVTKGDAASAGTILLDQSASTFGSLNIAAKDITLTDAAAIDLAFINAGNELTLTSGGDVTDSGTVTVVGKTTINAGTNAITLDNSASNYGSGTGSIALTGSDVSLQTNSAAKLDVIRTTGKFTLTAAGNVSDSAALDIDGTATINAVGNEITLTQAAAASDISGELSLTASKATLNNFSTALTLGAVTTTDSFRVTTTAAVSGSDKLAIGGAVTINAGASDITLSGTQNTFGDLTLTGGTIVIREAAATNLASVSGTSLDLASTGNITQTGAITLTGTSSDTAVISASGADITLNDVTNNVSGGGGEVRLSGRNVALTNADGLLLGTSTVTGTLAIETKSGNVTDSGVISVTGASTFKAAGSLTLNASDANATDGAVLGGAVSIVTGGDASLESTGAINFATSTVSGNLSVLSGAISDSGVLTVTGTTSLNAPGQTITLDNDSIFGGDVSLIGSTVRLVDTTTLTLGAVDVSGPLTLTSKGGDVTANEVITAKSSVTVSATGKITLGTTKASTFGVLSLSGTDVTVTDQGTAELGTIDAEDNLVVTSAGGDIVDSGVITVGKTSSFTAQAGGKNITLDSSTSTFTEAISLSGATIAVTNNTSTNLGTVTATGPFTLTSTGHVTDSGVLTIDGAFTVNASGRDVTLDEASNFKSTINFTAANVDVKNVTSTSTQLGNANASGSVSINANNHDITNVATSQWHVGGPLSLTAGTGDISVDFTNSVLGSQLKLSGNDLTVTNGTRLLELGDVTASSSGNLSITSSGEILDNPAATISVAGKTSISAAGQAINLDSTTSAFTGAITLSGNVVKLTNKVATTLDAVTATGSLTIIQSGTGDITDNGKIEVTGDTTLTASGLNIILDFASNTFGSLFLSGANVTINDEGALDIGGAAITGNLTLTSDGAVTDAGQITVAKLTSITTNPASSIVLDFPTSSFVGAFSLTGTAVSITASKSLVLGTVNADSLTLQVIGDITDSGKVTISGASNLRATPATLGGETKIEFKGSDSSFGGLLDLNATNVEIIVTGAATFPNINLGTVSVGGNLTVIAKGTITETGPITVNGAKTLNSNAP